ncbi:MAG: hypothetical protein JO247_17525 [Chloroflexi bacterium]|nr:hypothetical protein [Chloroflexota bacterium]
MQVRIDKAADAALLVWGRRKTGRSHIVELPSGNTMRVLLNDRGDAAGLELLGWSRRAERPFQVDVVLEEQAEELRPHDPLNRALAITMDGRPIEENEPMISMSEASVRTGRERSWLTREATSGRLRAKKVGREWWTTDAWLQAYVVERHGRVRTKSA